MQLPQIVEVKGIRVLTSRQIAKAYGVEEKHIKQNFANNRKRYVEGKHYVMLQHQDLREFKSEVEKFDLVGKTANRLYLWTEKGALLHAKSLNTDRAWDVYEYLVDFYFHAREQEITQQNLSKTTGKLVVDVPEKRNIQEAIAQIQDDLICTKVLLSHCNRYMSRDKYRELCNVVEDSVRNIQADFGKLCFIEPNEIEKII